MLRLEPRDVVRVNGAWRVRWRVTNATSDHIRLVAVRAPHSRFHSESVDLNVVVVESAGIEHMLRVEAAPGEDIENAFVILIVVKDHETWRVLFRVRVHVDREGIPTPAVEAMSSHRVGFSEA